MIKNHLTSANKNHFLKYINNILTKRSPLITETKYPRCHLTRHISDITMQL